MRIHPLLFAFSSLTLAGTALGHDHKHEHKHGHKHGAHEHGTSKFDVVVDGTKVRIELEGPAANIFGFEHTPKTDAEKKAVTDAMSLLRDPLKLFAFPADAGCTLAKADIDADQEEDMLKGKDKKHDKKSDDHAEVEAEWDFTCKKTPAGGKLLLDAFFKHFPKMQQLKLQLIVGDKQSGGNLTPKEASITL